MAKSINFDEGYKEYQINNDPDRVIRVDTADYGLLTRFAGAEKRLNEKMKAFENISIKPDGSADIDDEGAVEAIEKLSQIIKEETNYIFNADVSDIVFGNASPLSTRKGVPLYERFFNAIMPIIKADLEAENKESEKRIKKYTAQAQSFKKQRKRK